MSQKVPRTEGPANPDLSETASIRPQVRHSQAPLRLQEGLRGSHQRAKGGQGERPSGQTGAFGHKAVILPAQRILNRGGPIQQQQDRACVPVSP